MMAVAATAMATTAVTMAKAKAIVPRPPGTLQAINSVSGINGAKGFSGA